MEKKHIGTGLSVLSLAGSLFTGALGFGFVAVAVYMVYAEIRASGTFRLKFLMMPTMNVLIAAVLYFYCQQLFRRGTTIRRQLAAGTYQPPAVRFTRYDAAAIILLFLFAGVVTWYLGQR